MFRYFIKRILWLIPTLVIITIFGFWLFSLAKTNPVDRIVLKSGKNLNQFQKQEQENLKKFWTSKLGLNLPVFYFSIQPISEPDTLYKIFDKEQKEQIKQLINQTGNYQSIVEFNKELQSYKQQIITSLSKENDSIQIYSDISIIINDIEYSQDTSSINFHLAKLIAYHQKNNIQLSTDALTISHKKLITSTSTYKNYIPKIIWHGTKNQYHQWIFGNENSKGIIKGDFGISYTRSIPVMSILKDKILWSLLMSLLSIILAYSISIPIGKKLVQLNKNEITYKLSNTILFGLFCIPTFFMGVIVLLLLANPDIISILPPSGIKPIGGYSSDLIFTKIIETIPYIILPLICYTYSLVVYIVKTLTTNIEDELKKNYIQTAKAKGLENKSIIQHAYRNSLIPIISIFSQLFPILIGGSVIIESVFTIPGIGLEIIHAVMNQDYPIIIAIITLSALFTMISYLIADLLYFIVDPRIK